MSSRSPIGLAHHLDLDPFVARSVTQLAAELEEAQRRIVELEQEAGNRVADGGRLRAIADERTTVSFFDAISSEITALHERKAQDYASQGEFANFEASAQQAGVTPAQAIEVMIGTKTARLRSLERSGGTPNFESVRDTLLDRAVYCMIALAYHDSQSEAQTIAQAVTLIHPNDEDTIHA